MNELTTKQEDFMLEQGMEDLRDYPDQDETVYDKDEELIWAIEHADEGGDLWQ